MRQVIWRGRSRTLRRSRGQSLVVVALLLPLLILVLGVVLDTASGLAQAQRAEGAAQLAADAGATIAARDVTAILVERHWCQRSISYADWDTPACNKLNTNSDNQQAILLADCSWILQDPDFVNAAVSDSDMLARCIGRNRMFQAGWYHAISLNLDENGSARDVNAFGYSCAGLCSGSTEISSGCYSLRELCVEVSVTAHITEPFIGFLTAASATHTVQKIASAGISLPGSCGVLKSLIALGGIGYVPGGSGQGPGGAGVCPVH